MGIFLLVLTNLAFPIAALGVVGGFLFSPRRRILKNLRAELRERFAHEPSESLPQNAIWVHCASVGEVTAMQELISRLKSFYQRDILVSTSTQAGKETAQKNPNIAKAVLAPLDFYPFCRRFIRKAHPYRLFIVERELWPNMIEAAYQANIPTSLVNGRISQKSTYAYLLIKPLFKRILSHLHFAALQTEEDCARYQRLGMQPEHLKMCGNVKYDSLSDTPSKLSEIQQLLTNLHWGGKPVFVAGSTHPQEEVVLLRSAPDIIKTGTKIIFAPRHLERKAEIENMLRQSKLHYAFASQKDFPASVDILCLDTMGMLQSAYACSSLAFVGGSIVPRGAHNLLEPAMLTKTVLFGKYFYNTPLTAQALLERGGGILVNETNFKTKVLNLLADAPQRENMASKARATALSFKGATNHIMEVITHDEQPNA